MPESLENAGISGYIYYYEKDMQIILRYFYLSFLYDAVFLWLGR